jgi:O-antigen/teichoic acid export membrane protein
MRNPLRRSFAKNIGWLGLEKLIRLGGVFFTTTIVARVYGPADFGLFSLLLAVFGVALVFASLGLNATVTKEIILYPENEQLIVKQSIYIRFIGSIAALIAAIPIAANLAPDTGSFSQLQLILIYSLLLFSAFEVITLQKQAGDQFSQATYVRLFSTLISLFALVIACIYRIDIAWIAFLKLSEHAFFGIYLAVYHFKTKQDKHKATLKSDGTTIKRLLRNSVPLTISSFGAIIYLKIDQFMIMKIRGAEELGIYSAAVMFSEVWYFVPILIGTAALPKLAKLRVSSPDKYITRLQELYDICAAFGIYISILVSIFSYPLINYTFGKQYSAAVPILIIHIWAAIFIFVRAIFSKWLIIEDMPWHSFYSHISGAITNIALNLVLIPKYGGIGAAIATVISYSFASFISLFLFDSTREQGLQMARAIYRAVTFRSTTSIFKLIRTKYD